MLTTWLLPEVQRLLGSVQKVVAPDSKAFAKEIGKYIESKEKKTKKDKDKKSDEKKSDSSSPGGSEDGNDAGISFDIYDLESDDSD